MKKCILILSALFCLFTAHSQFQSRYFREIPPDDSSRYSLGVYGAGFFHNNEFFSTDEEGYTLPGNFLQPVFHLKLSEGFSLNAGYHLLTFHGQEGLNQSRLFLNLAYRFSEGGRLVIGSFNGGENHSLPEPLYARENHLMGLVMDGVLIEFERGRVKTRTWMDWERYIEKGDPFQESFSFAFTGEYMLIDQEGSRLSFPLYFLAHHQGGQINFNNEPVETIADFSTGAVYSEAFAAGPFSSLEASGLVFIESDTDNNGQGMAVLGRVLAEGELLSAGAGYFYGSNWESIHGNPLLFCGDNNTVETKSMILLKAGIGKKIGKGSSVSARFEGYYDTSITRMQYMYGIYLSVSEELWKK